MPSSPGINLLPEEGREEERTKQRKQVLALSSAGILLVIIILTLGSYAGTAYFRSQDATFQTKIDASSKVITSLKSVEILDRTVNNKLIRLQSVLASYPKFSTLLDDIAAFTPNGVTLTSLSFDSAGKLALAGLAASPANFGDFVNVLKDPQKGGAKFSNVEIISVAGGGKQGDYRFSLSMTKKGAS